ncbi:MAG: HAD family hydrolase [Oscillospiraceae bacterium]|nr:HAD family hydrolase [Oscillospiraceae bacterium]
MSTLYVSDLDGTLLNAQGCLSDETAQGLNTLIEQGLAFTVATARSPATVMPLLSRLHLRLPIICMTGTLIYDTAKGVYIHVETIPLAVVAQLCSILEQANHSALCYAVEDERRLKVYYKCHASESERIFVQPRYGTPYKTFEQTDHLFNSVQDKQVAMLLVIDTEEIVRPIYETVIKIEGVHAYYYPDEYGSGGCYLEIYNTTSTKALAIKKVMQFYKKDKLVSFGDNINDLPMFEMSDISCAVQNALPQLKQAATQVIGANTQDGVYKWLKKEWKQKKQRLED